MKKGLPPVTKKTNGSESNAPKLTRENTRIDWNKSLFEIEALINGLSPYPAAWTELIEDDDVKPIKIYRAYAEECSHDYPPLSLVIEHKEMKIAHPAGFIHFKSVQMPNKRRMDVKDLLNGQQFSPQTRVK